jgi:hypothetical protein
MHITPRKHRKCTKHRKCISSTHQQRRKAFTGKHKRRRRRAKGSRFRKGTSGGSGSTRREAIEEKKRKMKRWRGIESISFRLNERRNRAWVCCVFFIQTKQNVWFGFCEKNTANPVFVKKAQHRKNGFGFAVYGLLCMGLLCLVSGKNTGVCVCCVWVAWRREVARQGRNGETKGAFGSTKE